MEAGFFGEAATCFDVIFGCRVLLLRSGMFWHVLFCGFPEPLSLQGSSSNFLVLRIKAHKTIRVSPAWRSSQLWETGPEKVAFAVLSASFLVVILY